MTKPIWWNMTIEETFEEYSKMTKPMQARWISGCIGTIVVVIILFVVIRSQSSYYPNMLFPPVRTVTPTPTPTRQSRPPQFLYSVILTETSGEQVVEIIAADCNSYERGASKHQKKRVLFVRCWKRGGIVFEGLADAVVKGEPVNARND